MQMADEYGAYLCKADARTAQLHLRPLATVHQKLLPPQLNDLGRSIVTGP